MRIASMAVSMLLLSRIRLSLVALCLFVVSASAVDFTIPQGTQTGTVTYPSTGTYGNVGTVTAADNTTVFAAGSSVTVYATGTISLEPGFHASGEAIFRAVGIPVLPAVATLTGGLQNNAYRFTGYQFFQAAPVTNLGTQSLAYRIESVTPGTSLTSYPYPWRPTPNGGPPATAMITGTYITTGQELFWTPPHNATGTIEAFRVTAYNGYGYSAPPVPVFIQVSPYNNPPTITAPASLAAEGAPIQSAPVTVGDLDDSTGQSLTVTVVSSSDEYLLPIRRMVIGGSGNARTISAIPAATGTGTVNVLLRVSDGAQTVDATWVVTLAAASTLADTSDADAVVTYAYNPGGAIATMTAFNRQGQNVTAQTTTYAYESWYSASLNTKIIYPDSAPNSATDFVSNTYDRLGRLVTTIDQRGVARTMAYDNAGRVKSDTVTTYPAAVSSAFDLAYVPIPTQITTIYDNLSRRRLVRQIGTTNSGSAQLNAVTWNYDAWGQVATVDQDHGEVTQSIGYTYVATTSGSELLNRRLQSITYPNGTGPIYTYDNADPIAAALNRIVRVTTSPLAGDGLPINILAAYRFMGASTPVQCTTSVHSYAAGSSAYSAWSWDLRPSSYIGLDRFGRLAKRDWSLDGTLTDGQSITYNGLNSPVYRVQSAVAQSTSGPLSGEEAFTYDRLERLVRSERGANLAPGQTTGRSVVSGDYWSLDTLGNWAGFTRQDLNNSGGDIHQARVHNSANEIDNGADPVHNFALRGESNIGGAQPVYDGAGNLTQAPRPDTKARQWYTYDAWNRLCIVRSDNNGAAGAILASYVYDGLNRRVEERVKNTDYPLGRTTDVWMSDAWQELTRSIRRVDSVDSNAWRPGTALATGKPEEYYWDPYDADRVLGTTVARDAAGVPLASQLGGTGGVGKVRIIGLRYAYDSSSNVTAVVGVAYNDAANPPPAPMRLIERNRYSPYGERTAYRAANWDTWSQVPLALQQAPTSIAWHGFGLGVSDQVTGLVSLRNRWYDPALGRFMSRDPIGYGDGMNVYMYVHGGPLHRWDAIGLGDGWPVNRMVNEGGPTPHPMMDPNENKYNTDQFNELVGMFVPRPDLAWHQADDAFKQVINRDRDQDLDPTGAGIRKTGAALVFVGAAIAVVTDTIPGISGVKGKLAGEVEGVVSNVVEKELAANRTAGALGRQGEAAIEAATGLSKNTESFVVNGRTRIPDFIRARDPVTGLPTSVIESKNVQYQSLTSQLRDYRDLVGAGGRVDVALPPGARVSKPLQDAFDNPNNPLFRMDLLK